MSIKTQDNFIFAENDKGCISICTGELQMPPYISFYQKVNGNIVSGFPAMTLYVSSEGTPTLQLAETGKEPVMIDLFEHFLKH